MQVISFILTLPPTASKDDVQSFFDAPPQSISRSSLTEDVKSQLYWPVTSADECAWIMRFPEEELGRVTRAAWPFVTRYMQEMLEEAMQRFAVDVTVCSGPAMSLEQLADDWNQQFGRFTTWKLRAQT